MDLPILSCRRGSSIDYYERVQARAPESASPGPTRPRISTASSWRPACSTARAVRAPTCSTLSPRSRSGWRTRRLRRRSTRPSSATISPRTEFQISRPLCPYPQQARYKGAGDPNDSRKLLVRRRSPIHSLTARKRLPALSHGLRTTPDSGRSQAGVLAFLSRERIGDSTPSCPPSRPGRPYEKA